MQEFTNGRRSPISGQFKRAAKTKRAKPRLATGMPTVDRGGSGINSNGNSNPGRSRECKTSPAKPAPRSIWTAKTVQSLPKILKMFSVTQFEKTPTELFSEPEFEGAVGDFAIDGGGEGIVVSGDDALQKLRLC